MTRYVIKRILAMIPVALGVTILIFTMLYFADGDPARIILGGEASDEEVYELREDLGLNDSYVTRLGRYIKQVFFDFDLGTSYINKRSVSSEIVTRFPVTMQVAVLSVMLALLLGMPLGISAAVHQYSWRDNACMLSSLIVVSMPGFWVGLLLSLIFALNLRWLPASGYGDPIQLILPCVAIGLNGVGSIARQTRSSMLEVIRQDYIVTARAKGVAEQKVIYVHALRNALIPVITQVGTMLGFQLCGAIVAESVFSLPGLGSYMISAIKNRDYPAVQGSVLYVALVFGVIMLLIDILYAFVDPRIKARYQGKKRNRRIALWKK
ncbi:ABC transporter permease [Hominifimenecus sp. rT4P-3]|uniref:ABC transporter permease n=1 Tax=Hominifimenecus sp. rT4P-3 TaxID=3242979 RepID=UPI003DA68875